MASGTLSPSPYLTVLNATGTPYVGAKVNTYIAGTTTPAATYTDVGLTVANANPIITDSAGRYTAFLPPGASFKYVITDANGVAIKTIDNISAVPASASNLDLIGTAGENLTAGQAVYLSDGSGGKTAGQWYKTDPANAYSSSGAVVVGMVPASISSLGSGTIRLSGQITGLSALSLGVTYYVGTAGALTSTAPANARIVGVADTTSSLVISANPGAPNADNGINDFRLTLTTGTPVTSADVTAATTLFCTPYRGNRIALYNSAGGATLYTSGELSIAIPATTSQAYDVFCFANGAVPTLELLAWTNDTTRATALVLTTTGTYTKSGDLTRRYLGSCRTTTVSGQTEDSATKRYVSNAYNRTRRVLLKTEATASYAYSIATIRQVNGSAANQVDVMVGLADSAIDLTAFHRVSSSGTTDGAVIGIGEDSTTVMATGLINQETSMGVAGVRYPLSAHLTKIPPVGRHIYTWLEWDAAAGTSTWYGTANGAVSGIAGWIDG